MRNLFLTFVAIALSAPAAAQDVAPAVKRKPAAPSQAARPTTERDYQAALSAAAQNGGEAALDTSLIRVMSRLLAAGRCGEATSLATRDGRKELASRAQQLCR